jgi:hypothetical protein
MSDTTREDEYYDRAAEFVGSLQTVLDVDDFPVVTVNPVECATRDLKAWKADPKNNIKPSEIYRKWAKRLRELDTPASLSILRKLMLETTMPYNELENPYWIDSMTGEPIVENDNCVNCGHEVPLDQARCPNCNVRFFPDTPMPTTEWRHFLLTRFPEAYADPDVAKQAMAASSEWVGTEEEYYVLEDRDYEPETFTESLFTTEELPLLRMEIEQLAEALREQIQLSVIKFGREQALVQRAVRMSVEAKNYLTMCQNFLDRGEEIQDVFLLLRPFTHSYGYLEEDWNEIILPKLDPYPTWALPGPKPPLTLYHWAVEFEDMINVSEEGSPLAHHETHEQEIRDAAEMFLRQIVSVVPIEGDKTPFNPSLNPILRSKYFVEGFLRAQIDGSEAPSVEAWSYWRKKTSPAGAIAYREEMLKSSNRKRAMSAFWKAALKAGEVKGKPKKVTGLMPHGLKLADGRKVSWSTACQIADAEGFEEPERLKEKLIEHNIGLPLVLQL